MRDYSKTTYHRATVSRNRPKKEKKPRKPLNIRLWLKRGGFVLAGHSLREAEAPSAPQPARREPAPEPPTDDQPAATRIVTATLAEIYASQGEYQAAITAYRRLREQHPEEAGRFGRRIAELEESARLQHADQKS